MSKKKGFTLIELLVVIAIIALLLAILMPSLRKAKQIARDVVCRSNLKQWALIWAMYTDDHHGKFPADNANASMIRGEWIYALRQLWATEGDIVRCPSANKFKDFSSGNQHGSYTTTYEMGNSNDNFKEKCSYGMNCWSYSTKSRIAGDDNTNEKYLWKRINVRNAGNVPMFMDSMWRGGFPAYNPPVSADSMTLNPNPEMDETNYWAGVSGGIKHFAMPRHGAGAKGGTNVLFFDLSARHVHIKEMWKLKWHRDFNTTGYTANGGVWPAWMTKYNDF